jgi:hypothetical protein
MAMTNAIMDPTGQAQEAARTGLTLAPRRDDLSGATVGLLENGKQNARLFLEEVAGVLRDRHGVGEVKLRRKEVFSTAEPPEVIDEIAAGCDVVVMGVGDCGSCSAAAIADGVQFERHGTPAAVICSDAFVATADAMAQVQDAPGYRYVTTPHPVAGLSPAQVHERASQVAAEIAELLAAAQARHAA